MDPTMELIKQIHEELEKSQDELKAIQKKAQCFDSVTIEEKVKELKSITDQYLALVKEEKRLMEDSKQVGNAIEKSMEVLSRETIEKLEREVNKLEAKRKKENDYATQVLQVLASYGLNVQRADEKDNGKVNVVVRKLKSFDSGSNKPQLQVEVVETEHRGPLTVRIEPDEKQENI